MIVYQDLARYGPSIFNKVVMKKPQWIKETVQYDLVKRMEENEEHLFNNEEQVIIKDIELGKIDFYDRDFYDEVCIKLYVYIVSGKRNQLDLIDIIALPYLNYLLLLGEKVWYEAYFLKKFDVAQLYRMWKKNIPEFFNTYLKEGDM